MKDAHALRERNAVNGLGCRIRSIMENSIWSCPFVRPIAPVQVADVAHYKQAHGWSWGPCWVRSVPPLPLPPTAKISMTPRYTIFRPLSTLFTPHLLPHAPHAAFCYKSCVIMSHFACSF